MGTWAISYEPSTAGNFFDGGWLVSRSLDPNSLLCRREGEPPASYLSYLSLDRISVNPSALFNLADLSFPYTNPIFLRYLGTSKAPILSPLLYGSSP